MQPRARPRGKKPAPDPLRRRADGERDGFESLTIGSLAERTGLSKSGLFAHFGSKQELQVATLDEAARVSPRPVFLPAMKAPRG
jgi:AcrR family transcriptional regulator